jgi:hypothetical protein
MLDRPVGTGRVPKAQWIDRWLIDVATAFRRQPVLRPLWWRVKRLGIGDRLRALNTRQRPDKQHGLTPEERQSLAREFEGEIPALEKLLDLDLQGWRC